MTSHQPLRSSSALIVIDVQNDFCDDEGVHGHRGSDLRWVQQVVEPVQDLVDHARTHDVPVIFAQTHHDRWSDAEARYIRDSPVGRLHHVQPGAWGSGFYKLVPEPQDYVLTKRRYSAFFGTELDIVLRNLGVTKLFVTGVATNVCVETTVRDACMRDLDAVVVKECVAAYSEEAHQAALANVEHHFGRVLELKAVKDEIVDTA